MVVFRSQIFPRILRPPLKRCVLRHLETRDPLFGLASIHEEHPNKTTKESVMNKLNKTTSAILLSALYLALPDTAQAQSNPGDWGPDGYGKVLAAGDFNGDGYSDQAIANPSLGVRASAGSDWRTRAGSVEVKYGTQWGFTGYTQVLDSSTPGMPDSIISNASYLWLGTALAVGDFNDDGYEDLAIGAANDAIQGEASGGGQMYGAGSVIILYGSIYGLRVTGAQNLHQDTYGVNGVAEYRDGFGTTLAVGDFNRDYCDDLVIGVPNEDIGSKVNAGAVHVLWGSTNGVRTTGDLSLHQNSSGVPGVSEDGDNFGASLAVGDFDGDGYEDLAVGSPGEMLGASQSRAGMVNLFRGHSGGLSVSGSSLKQATTYLPWSINDYCAESFDQFGASLTAGDLNGDGRDELVVGVPGETLGSITNKTRAGAIQVYSFTHSSSFNVSSSRLYTQDSPSIQGVAESTDGFGEVLISGDLNSDGYDDIVIGMPGESIGSVASAGAVQVIYGRSDATSTLFWDQCLHQNSAGNSATAEAWDYFGSALSIGDFDGDGRMELTVGVPNEKASGNPSDNRGSVEGIIQVFEAGSATLQPQATTWNAHSS